MEPITLFFADRERPFRLTPALILELERVRAAGIGVLCRRVFNGTFSHADISETLRLGLIGGDATPAESAALVNTYIAARPLSEALPLAVAVLEHVWFGKPSKDSK